MLIGDYIVPSGEICSEYLLIQNKGLPKEEIHSNICVFVNKFLNEHDRCINPRNRRPTGCKCLDIFQRNNIGEFEKRGPLSW